MARPKAVPNIALEDQVLKLAAINCNWAEIAAVVGLKEDTVRKRFSEIYKKGRETGKMSLRRKMFDTAMGGNVTMQIWLSKQMLGYTEKIDQKTALQTEQKYEITLELTQDHHQDTEPDGTSA